MTPHECREVASAYTRARAVWGDEFQVWATLDHRRGVHGAYVIGWVGPTLDGGKCAIEHAVNIYDVECCEFDMMACMLRGLLSLAENENLRVPPKFTEISL